MPTARPGSRAPYLWLWKGGQQISTLELYDTRFVLLTVLGGRRWQKVASEVSEQLGIPIDTHVIGPEEPLLDETGEWTTL